MQNHKPLTIVVIALIETLILSACGATIPATDASITDLVEYTNTEGAFSIQYPEEDKIYEDQHPSVDGVVADAPDSVALQHVSTNGFVLSIAFVPLTEGISPTDFAASDDTCAVSDLPVESFTLGGENALLFKDTPCGPFGSSIIYATHAQMGYRILIESGGAFQAVKPEVSNILDTFKFLA